jgi:hypothetical protein
MERQVSKPNTDAVDRLAQELAKRSGIHQHVPGSSEVYQQPGRKGKAGLLSYHDPAVIQQLKVLAAELGTTQQKLIAEGLNYVFAKHGKPQIA